MSSGEIELGWKVRLCPYRCPECDYIFATIGLYQTSKEMASSSMFRSESGQWTGLTGQEVDYCPGCGVKLEDNNKVFVSEEVDDDREE